MTSPPSNSREIPDQEIPNAPESNFLDTAASVAQPVALAAIGEAALKPHQDKKTLWREKAHARQQLRELYQAAQQATGAEKKALLKEYALAQNLDQQAQEAFAGKSAEAAMRTTKGIAEILYAVPFAGALAKIIHEELSRAYAVKGYDISGKRLNPLEQMTATVGSVAKETGAFIDLGAQTSTGGASNVAKASKYYLKAKEWKAKWGIFKNSVKAAGHFSEGDFGSGTQEALVQSMHLASTTNTGATSVAFKLLGNILDLAGGAFNPPPEQEAHG